MYISMYVSICICQYVLYMHWKIVYKCMMLYTYNKYNMSKKVKSSKTNIEPINQNKAALEAKLNTMVENGRREIYSHKELIKFKPGSLISYMNKKGIFYSGGFLMRIDHDIFVYIKTDFKTKMRVKFSNVDKLWCGSVFSVTNDIISLVKTTGAKTSFPVKINNIIIYYARSNFDRKRFMCTKRYKLLTQWCDMFCYNNDD
jgi:hypothetical protein